MTQPIDRMNAQAEAQAQQRLDPDKPFGEMAERINISIAGGAGFGGAFVVVFPDGTSMESLLLDKSADMATFLMVLQAKVQTKMSDIGAAERRASR